METLMRSILTISLPKAKKDMLVKRAKKAGKNVSAYILSIIEMEQNLISEDELVEICKKGLKDYKEGKTKIFNPTKDYLLK
jgi:hypothetical protein